MKYLSGLLLSLSLATTASADILPPALSDGTIDSGAQQITFTDFSSGVDNSLFTMTFIDSGASDSNSMGFYLYDKSTSMATAGRFELFGGAEVGAFSNIIFNFDEHIITRESGSIQSVAGEGLKNVIDDTQTYGALGSTATTTSSFLGDLATLNLSSFEVGVYLQQEQSDGSIVEYFSHNHLNPEEQRMVGIYEDSTINGLLFKWEDEAGADGDYDDLVVTGTDLALVPAPTTLAIFGLALLGLVSTRRKA